MLDEQMTAKLERLRKDPITKRIAARLGVSLETLLAGAVVEIPVANAIGAAPPDRIDGRSWLRVFPPGAPQILSLIHI